MVEYFGGNMTSIRKTKKRLKRQLREKVAEKVRIGKLLASWETLALYEAAAYDIDLIQQQLQQLKRKKRNEKRKKSPLAASALSTATK